MNKRVYLAALLMLGVAGLFGEAKGELPKKDKKAYRVRTVENPHAREAAQFPGLVAEGEPRLKNVEVTIDGNYRVSPEEIRMTALKTPWMRTGLYVAPGELVTVEVPKGAGRVEYRISGYHCRLNPAKVKKLKRFPDVRKNGKLVTGKNEIYSDFGGHLYLVFPDGAPGRKLKFKVSGAVQSPDFVLGETDAEQWKKEVTETGVPWGEMVCDRVIFTLPIASMRKVKDPEEMMKFYKEMIEQDFNHYSGLADDAAEARHRSPDIPWRFVFDVQLCAGAAHAGYPIACSYSWADRSVDMDLIRNNDRAWGFYHEMGHNYQHWCWKWGTLGEVSCNFPIFHARNRMGTWPGRVSKYQQMVDELANRDFEGKDFDKAPFGHESRIVPFVQLAQEYGWELYRFLAKESRDLSAADAQALRKAGNDGRRDFFCLTTAKFAKQDLRPFYDAWGIKYSERAGAELAKYPAVKQPFWKVFDVNKLPKM